MRAYHELLQELGYANFYENVHCSLLPRQTQSFLCGKFSTPRLEVLIVF